MTLATFGLTKIIKAITTGNSINDEVANLVAMKRETIGTHDAMMEWVNINLHSMPEMVGGCTKVSYKNDKGDWETKEQDNSLTLWVIALDLMSFENHLRLETLTQTFINWSTDVKAGLSDELAKDLALAYIKELVSKNILRKDRTRVAHTATDGTSIQLLTNEITPEFQQELYDIITVLREQASMLCKPLRQIPMDWTDTSTGIGETANMQLISKYKAKTKTVAPKVLEAVNKLQKVRFVVSQDIIAAAKDMQLNADKYKKDSRFSKKETTDEANDIYVEVINYQHEDGYYFPITMDARGRMYYRGGLLTPQGVDFCKAAFQFAEKKALGINGFHAICIHAANVLGMDKVSITERRKYIHMNWSTIVQCKTHLDIRKHFPDADTFQALVAARELSALNDWSNKENKVSDFMSGLVCHQDGTCNGLQHMAAVTGDRATAVAVNCVASTFDDVPSDVYGLVANAAPEYAETQPAIDYINKYGRGMAKNPVMITSYGASAATIIKNTSKYLSAKKAVTKDSKEIGTAYLGAISVVAGAVTQLTKALKICVTNTLIEQPEKTKFTWVTADGFVACTEYRSEEQFRVRAGVLAARMRGLGKAELDTVKTKGAMAPNFIHSIDATHLRMVVRACKHDLVSVHDSIGSHAATYFDTATCIREKFVVVHAYNALDDLCFSMGQQTPTFDGDYDAKEALQSAYIFS